MKGHLGAFGTCYCICDACKRDTCHTMSQARVKPSPKVCEKCKWRRCRCEEPSTFWIERLKRLFR